jgi:indole-3-glycerol phosphate synthase
VILDDIAAKTRRRVAALKEGDTGALRKKAEALAQAEALTESAESAQTAEPSRSFEAALSRPGLSFICEVKKASPSKGIIAGDFPWLDIARSYEEAGADALSVLTEPHFFMGSNEYLTEIAGAVRLPVLRKDFIIDPCQIYEAKVLGAQAALFISALLDRRTLESFLALAKELGMAALTEVHDRAELETALDLQAGIIGINNRNLKTFEVDLSVTENLRPLIPRDRLVVSESGIQSAGDVRRLAAAGVDALLVGEALMRAADKKRFLAELRG